MEDDGKLILWGTLVVLLLIIIGIINPFLLILILSIFIYIQAILCHLKKRVSHSVTELVCTPFFLELSECDKLFCFCKWFRNFKLCHIPIKQV